VTRKQDRRKITQGRYRRKRFFLADQVFAIGGDGDHDPQDLIRKKAWGELMTLPTDVALRTTDHMGSMIKDMQHQWSAWMDATPLDPDEWPFFHDVYLDVLEEFDAAPFIAVHGYYRQATAGLRNALEAMTHACRYAVANDEVGFNAWRSNSRQPPNFGNSVDFIGGKPAGKVLDATLGGHGLFGHKPNGVLRDLYADVCRYVHSQPGYSSGDIWQSNGPVFVPRAFTQFWLDFCDTSLVCFALLKIAHPAAKGSRLWKDIAGNAGASWHGLAPQTVRTLRLHKSDCGSSSPSPRTTSPR